RDPGRQPQQHQQGPPEPDLLGQQPDQRRPDQEPPVPDGGHGRDRVLGPFRDLAPGTHRRREHHAHAQGPVRAPPARLPPPPPRPAPSRPSRSAATVPENRPPAMATANTAYPAAA